MTEQQHLTHIDEKGDVRMVDVSEKDITKRVAVAEGFISMHPDTLAAYRGGQGGEGRRAGMRARGGASWPPSQTSTLIPMCHPLNITKAKVECEPVHAGEPRRRPRGHPRDHHHGRHGQDRHRDGGAHRRKRGVPDHLRHVQGGRPRHGDHGRAPAVEGRRQDRPVDPRGAG